MSAPTGRDRHVLVVDDEPDLLGALRLRLSAAGYRVTTVSDGLAAVAAVRDGDPDVVVLDLVLPGLDGHAVLQRLGDLERGRPLPVLCLSARTGYQDQERAESGGAVAFMAKPYDPAELLAEVARLAG